MSSFSRLTTVSTTALLQLSLLLLRTRSCAAESQTVWATPHDQYSSSVGVLGCKINTDRIAYWPQAIDCNNICVSLTYGDRSVFLLRIDQSGGAYDISYDAWNYLITGQSATKAPTAGGATEMQAENVDASKCASLLSSGSGLGRRGEDGQNDKRATVRFPLSASNSMNFLNSCLEKKAAGNDSWVADHYVLYNILDPICTWGYDESCTLDNWPSQNQASCPHTLGMPVSLGDNTPVYNIQYPTGKRVLASSSSSTTSTTTTTSSSSTSASSLSLSSHSLLLWTALISTVSIHLFLAGLQ